MPRPGGGQVPEKPKNFWGSIKRLFKNLAKWKNLIVISLILAILSSIASIVAPNKLSSLTDEITLGIHNDTSYLVDYDKVQELSKIILNNISNTDYQAKTFEIINSTSLSQEDINTYTNYINSVKSGDNSVNIASLPESIINILFSDITYDGNKISAKDQVKFVTIMQQMENGSSSDMLKLVGKLPKSIVSVVELKINFTKIKKIGIILVILYLGSAIFNFIQGFSMTTVSNDFAKKLRTDITEKINRLPLKYYDAHETGDVLSRITNDVDSIAQNLNQSLSSLVSNITLFIGSIIMMVYTNWIMALTAIVASLFGFMFMGLILGKSQKYFIRKQTELGDLNGYIEEIYSGHTIVKAYNATEITVKEFDKLNSKLYKSNMMSQFLSGLMQPFMGFIGNFGYVAVCVVGALLALNGHITFGVIVAFIVYVRLFTNPLSQIAQCMTSMQSTAAAAERVFEFMDEKEMSLEKSTGVLTNDLAKGCIEFNHVKFGYDENKTIIKDFTAKVKPGSKIAIVGPTGAGKTTMVNLLMKFYDIKDGDIIIDGYNTKDLTRENIHNLFCMVLQDTWLFDGSIRDNIKFNQKDITDEEIWNTLKVVGIDHFVKTLPGGLSANINDSDTISGGQKQLFTIARGMLENAPFLILDEATSNVDTRTEELVQKAMDKLTKGKTSFIIAHRLSTIKNADLILVMKDGNIIEQGNHEDLIKANGFYAALYNSQFEL